MFIRKFSCAALIFLLYSISTTAMAGSFTPAVGTTITSNSVTIEWTSTAAEQWVRAYNSSAQKIFDSGRQMSSSGQVNFAVLRSETQLLVIFYEKGEDGSWVANKRTYSVAIGGTSAGGTTLADLSCSTSQIAEYDGAEWVCSDGLVDMLDPTIAAILMRLDALESSTYSIGDVGPAGGAVFHVTNGGLHGLEAAPEDQDSAQWCSSNTNIVGVDDIIEATSDSHSGAHNTPLIEAICGASSAAGVAAAYVWPNGQSDGFLPNKEELDLLYVQRNVVGSFDSDFLYWSSSESALNPEVWVWIKDFLDGSHDRSVRSSVWGVRAVRAF